MVDWNAKFKPEYDYARAWLAHPANFAADWQTLVTSLLGLMSAHGFETTRASALSDLRHRCRKSVSADGSNGEEKALLQAVGAWGSNTGGAIDPKAKMRAAALKMLRHVYLLNVNGNRRLWVHSLPKSFKDWTSDYLNKYCATDGSVRTALKAQDEQFTEEAKRHLSAASTDALAWVHKANIVLANAVGGGAAHKAAARDLVKRWFSDPSTTDPDLELIIATLKKGFHGITRVLTKGRFILTDYVPLRTAMTPGDIGFLQSEAFTFAGQAEGLDVVYIEKSFFASGGNVLSGQKNWTRILIHELSHLVAGTADVNKGGVRYAWFGIGPHAGFLGTDAVKNAESWAFFAVDCAGQLTAGERGIALKVV